MGIRGHLREMCFLILNWLIAPMLLGSSRRLPGLFPQNKTKWKCLCHRIVLFIIFRSPVLYANMESNSCSVICLAIIKKIEHPKTSKIIWIGYRKRRYHSQSAIIRQRKQGCVGRCRQWKLLDTTRRLILTRGNARQAV